MSQPESAAGPARGCGPLGCLLGVGGLVFFFFLMMAGIGGALIQLGWTFLFGWAEFLWRVVPKISWDWGALITSVLFAGLVGILAHHFLAWMTRGIAAARDAVFEWRWRWTLSGLLLCAFCFLVGMSVAGAAHQIGWILGGKESWFENRSLRYGRIDERTVEAALRQTLLEETTLLELRQEVPSMLNSRRTRDVSPLESVRLLVKLSSSNTVNGVLILSRDKQVEMRNAIYVTPHDSERIGLHAVQRFIQANATNLVAF